MSKGTMTSKGQITVPKDVRDALGLGPGTVVRFELTDDGRAVLSPRRVSLIDLAGSIEYSGPTISIDAMDDAIADEVASRT